MKRSKGSMSTRTKRLKAKKILTVADRMRSFEVGSKVTINPVHLFTGLPALRYINRYGTVVEKRGSSYVVEIQDGGKKKHIIADPIHLKLG